MRGTQLDDLTVFLAIAEHGSFRRAATDLQLSPSALSHAMRALEARIGVRLLNRTTRSVALTDAGARLAGRLRPAFVEVDDAVAEARDEGDEIAGRLRLTTMAHGATLLIEGGLVEFQLRHPRIEVELVIDEALRDLVADGFDAGVRFRDQVPPDMVAIPIAPSSALVAAAAPAYLERHAPPARPADLAGHRCIRQRLASGAVYRWEFQDAGRPVTVEPCGPMTMNSLPAIVAAAVRGAGICYVPCHQVGEPIAAGRLVRLLDGFSPVFEGHCLYYARSKHPTRAFTAFVQHMRRDVGEARRRSKHDGS